MTDVLGFREFEFDLPPALLEQLVIVLDNMDSAPLTTAAASQIPDAQGVYQLFHRNELVYIGKTDAESGLRRRIDRHARKIVHRRGIDAKDLAFKAVQILVFSAMDLETALIRHYADLGKSAPWNNSGFGANDPGRNRDHSQLKADHFDTMFPIDLEFPLAIEMPKEGSVADLLATLRDAVPYVIRYENSGGRSRAAHADLTDTLVRLPKAATTARELIEAVVAALPAGWQATQLPGYVILYKESAAYAHGEVIAKT